MRLTTRYVSNDNGIQKFVNFSETDATRLNTFMENLYADTSVHFRTMLVTETDIVLFSPEVYNKLIKPITELSADVQTDLNWLKTINL